MSGKTGIQWTDATWNPVTGCSRVSDGCRFCYAETISHRFKHTTKPWSFVNAAENVVLHPERLDAPLRWRTPQRVFVNSMSDLFHERVPDEFILQVFGIMAMTPQHTYQILTKRPERMRDWVRRNTHEQCAAWATDYLSKLKPRTMRRAVEQIGAGWPWPLPNVWLGTSVENQRAADERIPLLLQTPAAVRFLSCEPLLAALDLREYLQLTESNAMTDERWETHGWGYDPYSGGFQGVAPRGSIPYDPQPGLDWVIVGGESGPRARPMAAGWAFSLIAQCRSADVPVFVKQLGEVWAREHGARERHAGDPEEWPETLRIREFPVTPQTTAHADEAVAR